MNTILLTGELNILSQQMLRQAAQDMRLIIAGDKVSFSQEQNIRVYHTHPGEETFTQLFDVYSIDTVLYFSGYLDGQRGSLGEDQMLRGAISECAKARAHRLVFLSTIESTNYIDEYNAEGRIIGRTYSSDRAFGASQSEELVSYMAGRTGLKCITLRLPYLYDDTMTGGFIGGLFREMKEAKRASLPYHSDDNLEFVSWDDLLGLIEQITEETEDYTDVYTIPGAFRWKYSDLEEILRSTVPDMTVTYLKLVDSIHWDSGDKKIRQVYGFVASESCIERIGIAYRRYLRGNIGRVNRLTAFVEKVAPRSGRLILTLLELLLMFVITEFIARYTSDSVYFKVVDVRLFFVLIAGTMYGMRFGILAGLMECVVLVFQYRSIGIGARLLFYNIENWIPFVIYLLTGSITGYIHTKYTDEIAFAKKEYELLRDKYLFLSDVYKGALENKGEFKKQILGFKDSFGKIFDAVQRLDSVVSESIFFEGLQIMEDILENRTFAIYSIESWQRFGRLAICSNPLLNKLTKSIRLENYSEMMDVVREGRIWKNVEMKDGYPAYAYGIFRNDKLVLLITVQDVSHAQLSMYYMNMFRILCGLLQTSLLRAMDFQELSEQRMYYPGTTIYLPDSMKELSDVQVEMKEAGVADYTLLKFVTRDYQMLNNELTGMVRATDIVGADHEGNLYLLLCQMQEQNLGIVAAKLAKKGLEYSIVEKVGA